MKTKNKKIGIWGFGKVGRSAAAYFHQCGNEIEVMDARLLNKEEKSFLAERNIRFTKQSAHKITAFLQKNDFVLQSPGIDVRRYGKFASKFLTEASVIRHNFTNPIIGVTGTVGKTTVTTFISEILTSQNINLWTGGNIGVPMLALLHKKNVHCALLELSSFQLEQSKNFAPELAIWTNFHPNHLDRHSTVADYFAAKKNIVTNQDKTQHALLPLCLIDELQPIAQLQSKLYFFSTNKPAKAKLKKIKAQDQLFYLDGNTVMQRYFEDTWKEKIVCSCKPIALVTFEENGLIIYSALQILKQLAAGSHKFALFKNIDLSKITVKKNKKIFEHRLELTSTIAGVTFYNDSKSTTTASTLAAVEKLSSRPILLLLGGLNKGVNRTDFIKQLKKKVACIYAFGAEAAQIKKIADRQHIPCAAFKNLDLAVMKSFEDAQKGDQILLSPAGSSFDLFKNYKHRGDHFKKLVKWLREKKIKKRVHDKRKK